LPPDRLAADIVRHDTVIAWHPRAFRRYWTWKSRHRLGRPAVSADVRALIRTMSHANPLWGAPRIHGELLKVGIEVSQASVSKYLVRPRRPSSQSWRTFLANHVHQILAADFFVVPTATGRLLFVLVMLAHQRRRVIHMAVTEHPTAVWTAQQLRFTAAGLERLLTHYIEYYERSRTHLALDKDAPITRPVSTSTGRIIAIPQVGGLHHRYERIAA